MMQSRSLQELLPRLERFGDQPAVVSFGEVGVTTISFAELEDRVVRFAGGLLAQGIGRGEPVALFAPNSPEWITAALAIIAAGAVVVPLDIRLGARALAHEVADCGCTRAFAIRATLEALHAAAPQGHALGAYLLDATEDGPDGRSWTGLYGARPQNLPEIASGDTAALFYTSGTTGLPKGVPLSHGNLLSNLEGLRTERLAAPGVRALLPLPLHHVYPFMVGMLVPLDGGATVVLPAGISGPDIVQALRQAKVTVLIGVPRLYEALASAIRRRVAERGRTVARLFSTLFDVSVWLRRRLGWRAGRLLLWPLHRGLAPALKIVASGGAALDETVGRTLEGLGWEVLTGYGLTETSPIITFTGRGRGRIGAVGRPLPGVEVRCVPVSDLPGGEIQVRGPNVFSGYRNRPEADRDAFTEDGWFRTGDLGMQDKEGYLRLLARVSETIVLPDGKNVYPEEVEDVYAESPYLREAAVLQHDGALAALVVPDVAAIRQAGRDDFGTAVREEVRRLSHQMAPHQRVTDQRVTFDELPRTTLGKLRRHLLPAAFEAAAKGPAAPTVQGPPLSVADRELLNAPLAQEVLTWLQRRCPDRPVTLDADPQTDLGIDSLAWVSLTLELEQLHGIRLGEPAIARISSVRDLIEEVLEVGGRAFEAGGRGHLLAEEARWLAPTGAFLRVLGLAFLALDRVVFRRVFRLSVEGRDHLPPSGPVLITPNHVSFLDVFALGAALPTDLAERTYWAGTTLYLFSSRARRFFSRMAHVIPVDHDRAALSGFLLAAEGLKRGKVLVWFPEGRRSIDGRLQAFMPGVGWLADDPETRFVPVAIKGTLEAWPRDQRFPRPHRVSVSFGAPVSRRTLAAAGEGRDEAERISDGLHRRLAALLERSSDPAPAGDA
jgi:long-chain acyl-CoA synthetase